MTNRTLVTFGLLSQLAYYRLKSAYWRYRTMRLERTFAKDVMRILGLDRTEARRFITARSVHNLDHDAAVRWAKA